MDVEKVAIIDLGTNTFHLLIAEVKESDFKVLLKEKVAVKIGKGGINEGFITDEAQHRAIDSIKTFSNIIKKAHVDATYATGTSAMRNARNGQELAEKIKKETGIHVNIIDGREEARLIYFGVNKALKIGNKPVLVMDIGGGSVEFIICDNTQIFWVESFEIGGQRLVERFQKHDPILPSELDALKNHIRELWQPLKDAVKKFKPKTLIGCSGTFDTLSDIHRLKQGIIKYIDSTELPISIKSFHDIYHELKSKNREERLLVPGMIEMRADMIVVACALIDLLLTDLDIKKLRASAYALKEGVLLDTISKVQSQLKNN
jgi:exopolyphosphatase/guanosine-5'-triphosphate,3'-diphosphate pyrophosphatase